MKKAKWSAVLVLAALFVLLLPGGPLLAAEPPDYTGRLDRLEKKTDDLITRVQKLEEVVGVKATVFGAAPGQPPPVVSYSYPAAAVGVAVSPVGSWPVYPPAVSSAPVYSPPVQQGWGFGAAWGSAGGQCVGGNCSQQAPLRGGGFGLFRSRW